MQQFTHTHTHIHTYTMSSNIEKMELMGQDLTITMVTPVENKPRCYQRQHGVIDVPKTVRKRNKRGEDEKEEVSGVSQVSLSSAAQQVLNTVLF